MCNRDLMWSALAHVKPKVGSSVLGEAIGGYVSIVALASDEADLLRRTEQAFGEVDLTVSEIEDILLLDEDQSWELVSGEVLVLSEAVTPDTPFRFGAVHTYQADTDVN